jgi:hypothetical protein
MPQTSVPYPPHRKTSHSAKLLFRTYPVGLLDLGDELLEKCVFVGLPTSLIVDVPRRIRIGHDDHHRRNRPLRDSLIGGQLNFSELDPGGLIVREAVEQIHDRVAALGPLVPGRQIHGVRNLATQEVTGHALILDDPSVANPGRSLLALEKRAFLSPGGPRKKENGETRRESEHGHTGGRPLPHGLERGSWKKSERGRIVHRSVGPRSDRTRTRPILEQLDAGGAIADVSRVTES